MSAVLIKTAGMGNIQGGMSRRSFVLRAGQTGGGIAAWRAMMALGLLAGPTIAKESPPPLEKLSGGSKRRRVIILGAGLCGMASAYELGKLGYDCELVEARDRAGGRCWTVRGGTTSLDIDGQSQTAQFAEGVYMNPGPARIPGHHTTTLGYCREFGVPIEVFNNLNESAWYAIAAPGGVGCGCARPVPICGDMWPSCWRRR